MHERTDELKPGDVVIVDGKPAMVEYVAHEHDDTYIVHHDRGGGLFKAGGLWLIETPLDDVVKEAETIIKRGEKNG